MQCYRICSDHNEDHSVAIVSEWLSHVRDAYNDVEFLVDESEIGTAFMQYYNMLYRVQCIANLEHKINMR